MNYYNRINDEDLDELMEAYASKEAVQAASREKQQSEVVFEEVGIRVKDYPNPQRDLDLHGKTQQEAMFELTGFIDRAIQHRLRTVRVITGKGLHSKHMKSVLPELTEKRLAEMRKAGKVLAFKREKNGGSFAVYLIS